MFGFQPLIASDPNLAVQFSEVLDAFGASGLRRRCVIAIHGETPMNDIDHGMADDVDWCPVQPDGPSLSRLSIAECPERWSGQARHKRDGRATGTSIRDADL